MYVQHHYARIIGLSAVGIFVVLLLKHFNIGDHSYHLWLNLTTAESAKQNAFWLPDMSMSVEAHKIGGISDNLSGITYVKESDSFYVVLNRPPTILELDRRYEVVRQARLAGFGDSEGIAYAGNNKLLVLDERAQSLSILPLNGWGDALEKADHPSFTLALYDETNSGFEGIAVDRATQTVYVARENSPRKILKISGLLDETQFVNVTRVGHEVSNPFVFKDLSGLHFSDKTDSLLILSHKSHLLAEMDSNWNIVNFIGLNPGLNGLNDQIPQAEGVTVDNESNLYIVSEPNLLYRFQRDQLK